MTQPAEGAESGGRDDPPGPPQPGSDARTIRKDPAVVRGEVWVRDFALVTYRVPVARLQGKLPASLECQTFRDDEGRPSALVSATCFLNHDLGWAGGPSPRLSAHQATYRTYVRHGDELGSFFLASYLGTSTATVAQKLGIEDTRKAHFEVDIERNPAGGYVEYRAVMTADDGRGVLHVTATDPPPAIPPFGSGHEHVRFLTHRLHGYAYSLLGLPVDAQVEHAEMSAYGGSLLEGHFPPLERLGVVPFHEQGRPYSVLVSPGVRFELLAPVPLT